MAADNLLTVSLFPSAFTLIAADNLLDVGAKNT